MRLMASLPIVKFLIHQDSPNPLLKAKIDMNHAGENLYKKKKKKNVITF